MVRRLLAVFATVGLLAPASIVIAASATRKTVIAHAAMNARVGPLWIAREQNLFAKYGIDADTIFVRGAPILVAAMSAGEIEVCCRRLRYENPLGFYEPRDVRSDGAAGY